MTQQTIKINDTIKLVIEQKDSITIEEALATATILKNVVKSLDGINTIGNEIRNDVVLNINSVSKRSTISNEEFTKRYNECKNITERKRFAKELGIKFRSLKQRMYIIKRNNKDISNTDSSKIEMPKIITGCISLNLEQKNEFYRLYQNCKLGSDRLKLARRFSIEPSKLAKLAWNISRVLIKNKLI